MWQTAFVIFIRNNFYNNFYLTIIFYLFLAHSIGEGESVGESENEPVGENEINCENDLVSDNLSNVSHSSSSNASPASFVQTFNSKTCGHLDLGINDIIRILAENEKTLKYIPDGLKENVWFVLENGENVASRSKNNRSAYDLVRHKPMILTFAYMQVSFNLNKIRYIPYFCRNFKLKAGNPKQPKKEKHQSLEY